MSIDEAIAMMHEWADYECYNEEQIQASEAFNQIAEWLEELKAYRTLDKTNFSDEYNRAIDDFAEKLNAKCDGMIKDKWNSNVAPVSWAEAYADFNDDIDEIAEQLKEKKING